MLPTSRVDPESRGTQADIELPCEGPAKPIMERLGEPMPEAGEYCMHQGKPYVLFSDWDYAEDWSGHFVRTVEPSMIAGATKIGAVEFWTLVRGVHEQG
jgi:hypothetical protein